MQIFIPWRTFVMEVILFGSGFILYPTFCIVLYYRHDPAYRKIFIDVIKCRSSQSILIPSPENDGEERTVMVRESSL
ncbi:hypothetical protein EB796_019981 [Bugula neritina]|uniref:Uncharacterized protein n=1 Tax=Bugula neritina TaxID=10212 RepID=A0A7J7J7R5_BUGNE|nr:hypothetical protein EB796_019981 [Bugula neritina]